MEKQFEELGMTPEEIKEFYEGLERWLDKREDQYEIYRSFNGCRDVFLSICSYAICFCWFIGIKEQDEEIKKGALLRRSLIPLRTTWYVSQLFFACSYNFHSILS